MENKLVKDSKYPSKLITIIVPTSPGSSLDLLARAMEKVVRKYLDQSFVIINIPGGVNGWHQLIESKSDGYTIALVAPGIILQPLLHDTKYNYLTAIEPIAQFMSPPTVVSVLADQPWKNIDDLTKYAKENPHKIKFGHTGLGAPRHITGELFAKEADIKIDQVPFNGGTEEVAAILGRHIQLIITDPSEVREFVKNGTLKALAVSSDQRLTDPEFKDVPTFKEQGLNIVMEQWVGIGAPKDLPEDVKLKLNDSLKKIANDSDFKKEMENLGITINYLDSQPFLDKWVHENERLKRILKDTGIIEMLSQKN